MLWRPLDTVTEYYGSVLTSSRDLRTDACCDTAVSSPLVRAAVSHVHPEVTGRYYGCGLVAPDALDGLTVLDLGSGSGRDAYVLAQLVGERGRVIGVDATARQVDVATRHLAWHAERFGYRSSNVEFHLGDIARLDALPH
ncbi:MAG: methyltransferase domain-containing protein [Gemmatimonadales bacterium]|nr:methyltransferase domain-containing protein [Gemmatimonadales bacterium]